MQVLLDELAEQLVEQLAPPHRLHVLDTERARLRREIVVRHRRRVETAVHLQRLEERQAAVRRREIDRVTVERNGPRAVQRVDDCDQHLLDQVHHVAVVGERLVQLEHGELGVVRAVDPLVPEVLADLVHPLESADDQALQVQLVRDAQVERHVERVVMRREWTRGRTTVQRLEDRRLDFDEPALVEEAADRRDDARAQHEYAPHLRVYGQAGVALAVALLDVGEPVMDAALTRLGVHLLLAERQRPDRLREQLEVAHLHRHLAHARPEDAPLDTNPVADVEEVEKGEAVAQVPAAEVELDATLAVREVREQRLAVRAQRDQPSAQADRTALPGLVQLPARLGSLEHRAGRCCAVGNVVAVGVWLDAGFTQGLELLQPVSDDAPCLLHHRYSSPYAAPAPYCFRYAVMNG